MRATQLLLIAALVALTTPAAAATAAPAALAPWAEGDDPRCRALKAGWQTWGLLGQARWHEAASTAFAELDLTDEECFKAVKVLRPTHACRKRAGSDPASQHQPVPPMLPCKLRLFNVLLHLTAAVVQNAEKGQLGVPHSAAARVRDIDVALFTAIKNSLCLLRLGCSYGEIEVRAALPRQLARLCYCHARPQRAAAARVGA